MPDTNEPTSTTAPRAQNPFNRVLDLFRAGAYDECIAEARQNLQSGLLRHNCVMAMNLFAAKAIIMKALHGSSPREHLGEALQHMLQAEMCYDNISQSVEMPHMRNSLNWCMQAVETVMRVPGEEIEDEGLANMNDEDV